METIMKYSNRKLYSLHLKKHVTLPYIIDNVRSGQKFIVLRKETKEDVTIEVLSKAIELLSLSRNKLEQIIKES